VSLEAGAEGAGVALVRSDSGQTVVPTATTLVTSEVERAGQSVTVEGQAVTVKIWVL
jgi:hypothetical protein